MKYMRWSYDQLMGCPVGYVEVIAEIAREEAAAKRRAVERSKG